MHANKRILVDVVKNLMPEVPRDRWGVVATASPREYLILYRNYRFSCELDMDTFVRPGIHLPNEIVLFDSHNSALPPPFYFRKEDIPADRPDLERKIMEFCIITLYQFMFSAWSFNGSPRQASLSVARSRGLFSFPSARATFIGIIETLIAAIPNVSDDEKAKRRYLYNLPPLNALLHLLKTSFAIGMVEKIYYPPYFLRRNDPKPICGVHVDVSEADVALVNAGLPSQIQIVMCALSETLPLHLRYPDPPAE